MKFEIGKTYSTRSICDYECIFSFKVIGRTEKTVTIESRSRGAVRRKVRVGSDGVERCDPHGRYSMSPVLSADEVAA
jgi:hypothetical protein